MDLRQPQLPATQPEQRAQRTRQKRRVVRRAAHDRATIIGTCPPRRAQQLNVMHLLEPDRVRHTYGKHVVAPDLAFDLDHGEIPCLLDVLLRPDDVIHDDASDIGAEIVTKASGGAEFLFTLPLASGAQVLTPVPSHHDLAIAKRTGIRLAVDHVVTLARGR
jgi:hypothetical protein